MSIAAQDLASKSNSHKKPPKKLFDKKILMCAPTFFRVSYKINPWMDPLSKDKVNEDSAWSQWNELHHLIIRLGGYVEYIEPVYSYPDLVFTANAGLYHNNKVVLANFKHKERQGESEKYRAAFEKLGYEIWQPEVPFEGAGDAFVVNDTLFLGYGHRTSKEAAVPIMEYLGLNKLVLCELVDPYFYHLDTCFCPLGCDTLLYNPLAFSENTRKAFGSLVGYDMIEVSPADASKFACNAVVLKNNIIIPEGCSNTESALQENGFVTHSLPMDQFLKSGGACKCLTLTMSDH